MSTSSPVLLFALCALMPTASPAEEPANAATSESCVIDTARVAPPVQVRYVDQAWATRNELFLRACRESDGAFVDVTDPTLNRRLVRPTDITAENSDDHYPPELRKAGLTGWVDVMLVIELDGSVSHITPAQGAEAFRDAAVAVAKTMKFKQPALLDGKPIRSLMYTRFTFQ